MKKTNNAFSLIELSIVILIIGVLISGVVTAQSLLAKSRLYSARQLTKGSPVLAIRELVLWLETTSVESFDNYDSLAEATSISTWHDINPNAMVASDAKQSASGYRPLFYSNGINGLPALKFDGIDDDIDSSAPYFNSTFPAINNNFAIFVVAYPSSIISLKTQANSGITGTTGQKYLLGAIHGSATYVTLDAAGMGISFGTNGISFFEHSGGYMPALMSWTLSTGKPVIVEAEYVDKTPVLYINGNLTSTGLTSLRTYVFPPYQIGGGAYGNFQGYIGEVIVFSKNLQDDDRNEINSYLKQKWGIK